MYLGFCGLGAGCRAPFAIGVFVPVGAGVAVERFAVSPVQYPAARTPQLTALEDYADGHDEHGDRDGGDGKRQERHLVLSFHSRLGLLAAGVPRSKERRKRGRCPLGEPAGTGAHEEEGGQPLFDG